MNSKVLIFPWARNTRNGKKCAKNYPFWNKVCELLRQTGVNTIQVSGKGEERINADELCENLALEDLLNLLRSTDTFVSIDSFGPHFAHHYKRSGVVIFSRSDPNIFGYPENINLLKDRKFLRPKQFEFWDDVKYEQEAFVSAEEVVEAIMQKIDGNKALRGR